MHRRMIHDFRWYRSPATPGAVGGGGSGVRGPGQGGRVPADRRLPTRLTGLARGEAEALFLSGVPGALREMGLEDAASAARLKVSAALLPSLRDASRTAAQRFHLDAPGWFNEPATPELLPAVADAVWDDRRVARPLPARAGARGGADAGAVRARPQGGGLVPVRAGRRGTAFRVYRIDRFTAVTAARGGALRAGRGVRPARRSGRSGPSSSRGPSCGPRSSYGCPGAGVRQPAVRRRPRGRRARRWTGAREPDGGGG